MKLAYASDYCPRERDVLGELHDKFYEGLRGLRGLLNGPLLAITQAMCTSFKKEMFEGKHNFMVGGNNMKISLYVAAATLDATTTAYTAANEVANGNGYTTTGKALVNVNPTSSGTTGFTDFDDVAWTAATFTARGALIYNDDAADRSAAVLDFGSDKTVTSGTFTIQFPVADAANAILRIA